MLSDMILEAHKIDNHIDSGAVPSGKRYNIHQTCLPSQNVPDPPLEALPLNVCFIHPWL